MNTRIATIELIRIARMLLAKDAPTTMFERTFFDIRQKAKNYKEQQSLKAGEWLQAQVQKDLTEKGFVVQSVDLSLGKYKGSRFVTSAKLYLTATPTFKNNDSRLTNLLSYLQAKYSPKYQLKGVQDGVAFFNVR